MFEKRGLVGILCMLGDIILFLEVLVIVCVVCIMEFWMIEVVVGMWVDIMVDVDVVLVGVVIEGGCSVFWMVFWIVRERVLDSVVIFICIVLFC